LYLATATATASTTVATAAVKARLSKEAAGMVALPPEAAVAGVGCCMDMGAMNASAGRDGEIMSGI
jgi:hypothetical protein